MRTLIIILMSSIASALFAQSAIKENYKIQSDKIITLKFDYPQLIKIETWDSNEIQITGSVNINNGEYDNKFKLFTSNDTDGLTIEGKITDIKNLPQIVTAIDGKDTLNFKSKEEYQKYSEKNNRKFRTINMGPKINIQLAIKVPKNKITHVESTYGMVEVKDFKGPLSVQATYGGIDATLQPKSVGELTAETNYGKIYSNLEHKFKGNGSKNFHTLITAVLGSGPSNKFESKYGNIYLRKF